MSTEEKPGGLEAFLGQLDAPHRAEALPPSASETVMQCMQEMV